GCSGGRASPHHPLIPAKARTQGFSVLGGLIAPSGPIEVPQWVVSGLFLHAPCTRRTIHLGNALEELRPKISPIYHYERVRPGWLRAHASTPRRHWTVVRT